jgi:hypothetical protein
MHSKANEWIAGLAEWMVGFGAKRLSFPEFSGRCSNLGRSLRSITNSLP